MRFEGRGIWIVPAESWGPEPKVGERKLNHDLDLLKRAGFNFVIPLAKDTSGKAGYHSEIMASHTFKEWDPIEVATRQAHKLGMKIYPWLCVFSEGEKNPDDVLRSHDDWAVVDARGKKWGFGDPAKPDVRSYGTSIALEILGNYDVDGLMLDYTRYPGPDFCYCDYCCGKFKEQYGVSPKDLPKSGELREKWDAWRREQVTSFVKELSDQLHRAKPGAELGSYCWTTGSLYNVYQDWPAWARRGYLDLITPSGYVYDMDLFRSICLHIMIAVSKVVPTYVTIGVETSHGKLRKGEVAQQIRISREEGLDGVTLFHWESVKKFLPEIRRAFSRSGSAR